MRNDFHLHTIYSDGGMTPAELMQYAKQNQVGRLAITDHDTVAGVREAKAAAKQYNITCLAGIEVSSYRNGEIHILGLNVDIENTAFQMQLQQLAEARNRRNREIIARLNAMGKRITEEEVYAGEVGSVGRLKIAQVLKRHGYVQSENEAFDLYIGNGKPAHVKTNKLTPEEAIALIRCGGGVPVLAHPKLSPLYDGHFQQHLKNLVDAGLQGIEAYYPVHTNSETREFITLANRYSLIVTGGSDFHSLAQSLNAPGSVSWNINSRTAKILGL